VSHPRHVVNEFVRRKPRHVRQTRSFSLAAFGMLILSHMAGAQPLGINPSAAPSDIGNPSSINPAARADPLGVPAKANQTSPCFRFRVRNLPGLVASRGQRLSLRLRAAVHACSAPNTRG
jgi:hypothetical protein